MTDLVTDPFRLSVRLRASRLPAALRGLAWEDLAHDGRRAAIDDARTWAEGHITGLLLEGAVGTGKTRIAATAANHYLHNTGRLRWASAPALVAQLSAGLGTEQRDEALDLVTDTGALVLDDLDKTRPSAYAAEQLFLAIETRITHGAPLIVTTNLALREIASRYEQPLGEAIASRLAGYCQRHSIVGSDRRTEESAR
jgi:DNA replication protein DnaC